MENEIKELNRKIDFLTEQVTSLTARLQPIDELKEDLVLFTNDAFSEVIKFLSEVDFSFRSEDFVDLIKNLLRNTENLNMLISQLQSFVELFEDVAPLAKDMFDETVDKFEEFEKAGIFKKRDKVSIFKIIKKARSQEVLQTIDLLLDFAKVLNLPKELNLNKK